MKNQVLYGFVFILAFSLFGFGKGDKYVNRAGKYYVHREYEKAIDELLQGTKKASKSPRVFYNLGNIYLELGQFMNAKLAYESAIIRYENIGYRNETAGQFSPLNAVTDNLAQVYLVLGNFQKAQDFSHNAQKLGFDDAQPLRTLLYSYMLLGDSINCMQSLQKYQKLVPNDISVQVDSALIGLYTE